MKDRIKKIRTDCHMTQEEFSKATGIKRDNIAGYETGRRSPSASAVKLICDNLNVDEDWLRNGIGDDWRKPTPSNENRLLSEAFKLYENLTPAGKEMAKNYIQQLAEMIAENEKNTSNGQDA